VTFTGRVKHDDIEAYYSLIDIAPFPRSGSLVTELVSPLKPLEAMSMEKCVIVSDVEALAEMVCDRETGFVIEKDDKVSLLQCLKECILDEEVRSRLGKAARQWVVEHRDWKVLTKSLESHYDTLLESPRVSDSIGLKDLRSGKINSRKRFNQLKEEGYTPRIGIPTWDITVDELDFESDPFDDRNWRLQINSLRPLDPALLMGGPGINEHFDFALVFLLKWIACDERYGSVGGMRWNDMATGNRALRLAYIYQNIKLQDYSPDSVSLVRESVLKHFKVMMQPHFIRDSNHGLFAAHGLMALAVAYKGSSIASEARRLANRRFEVLVNNQFDDEGVHIENSPEYHFFVYNAIMGFLDTGWYGIKDMRSKFEAIQEAGCWLVWPNLCTVPAGDSFPSVVSNAWIMHKMNHLDSICERYFLDSGKGYLIKEFSTSGYTIIRSPFSTHHEDSSMLFCLSAFNNNSHRHSDDLSFQLFEKGKEVFIDPGKYSYDHQHAVRKMIISTRAHNCLEIDGRDYSRRAGPDFYGATTYESARTLISQHPWGFTIRFSRRWESVTTDHLRHLLYHPGEFLIVIDILKSTEERTFRQWFHLNEEFQECRMVEDTLLSAEGDDLHLNAQFQASGHQTQEISIHRGEMSPIIGWRSRSYRDIQPIHSICHSIKGEQCILSAAFSLSGGDVDLQVSFEEDVLSIEGMINGVGFQSVESVRFKSD